MMMMVQEQQQDSEDTARCHWLIQHLCETDRVIVKRKRGDVQRLIQQYITATDSTLAVVPVVKKQQQKKRGSLPRHLHLDWDAHWPSTDHFYQQIASMLGLPTTIQDGSKITASSPPQNMIVAKTTTTTSDRFDIKSLRTVMEHELQELGLARLHQMECSHCKQFCSADNLFADSLEASDDTTVTRCGKCYKGNVLPPHSIFDRLIQGIAEKWAKMVGKRVECLYGDWDERLNPMVKMLKENVLLADDIAALLRTCVDPQEFKDACEVIIITTIVFYLEYVDFRRSCEALLMVKPSVTHSQLFEIFAIYFPNRAKGIKTGDFL
ncbi:hypothetical protein CAEBREN_25785 [Caenorhabditis brenneri]|uniref:Uncharacterized protein n=1 Tax=Caenorhabditis brenneri TaxID=135651 RepID=G0NDJ6_CAEBE|nr:hypothetical protein CAEBREN_25785 [Caenorhabditis brenneri]